MKRLKGMVGFSALAACLLFIGAGSVNKKAVLAVSALQDGSATKGVSGAPVTLLVYSDFQCPACAEADQVIDEILAKYPGKVFVIFRYYPLEAHRHGFSSAIASECAKRQGRFWSYHDLLFEKQAEWGKNDQAISLADPANLFSAYARTLGLKTDEFNRCLISPEARNAVLASRQEGDLFRIMSTPTFFINNERVVGIRSLKARYAEIISGILRKR